jgi:phosphoribosyl-dephospho-CoA transferase
MHSRHDLVWLSDDGWEVAQAAVQAAHAGTLAGWRRAGWPLVVTRQDPGAGADTICLGLALPPAADGAKQRIALQAPADSIARSTPALALSKAIPAAPNGWKQGLAALAAASPGLTLRVYGSLALQAITGQAYLRSGSDIDLLFYPATTTQLRSGLALLQQYAEALPLDGEVVFPGGQAVAWKEWAGAEGNQARVLAKSRGGVQLAPIQSLLSELRP